MSEQVSEQELPDPATMPEKMIEVYNVIRLTDGRVIEEYVNGMYGVPDNYDFSDLGSIMETMARIREQGFEAISPDKVLVPQDGKMVELPDPSPMGIPLHMIADISEKVVIRDLEGEQEIKSALHNRQIRELKESAALAEQEERKNGLPNKPVVPESEEALLYVQRIRDFGVREIGNSVYVDLSLVMRGGGVKTLRLSPHLAHDIGHFLLDGPPQS